MERKYAGTVKTCKHPSGKWRNFAKWRPADVPGEWHQVSHLTTVPCSMEDGDNTGRRKAENEGRAWFNALIADEAHRTELEAAEAKSRNEGHGITADTTVAEYCAYYVNERLPSLKALEASTIRKARRYEGYVSKEFNGYAIGRETLASLTRPDVIRWAKSLADNYAAVPARESLAFLRNALEEARKDGFIHANPANDVTSPAKQAKAPAAWLSDEARFELLSELNETLGAAGVGTREYTNALAVKLALFTGLRGGEVCALTWADVDLGEKPCVTVRRSIGRGEDEGGKEYTYIKTPKSERGKRTVPLYEGEASGGLCEDLRRYRAALEEQITEKRVPYALESLYVVGPANEGSYKDPKLVSRAFKRTCERLNLTTTNGSRPHFHDLRHTYATVAAHSGVPETALMEAMGHSSIGVTHAYYIGVDPDATRIAMEPAARALTEGAAR